MADDIFTAASETPNGDNSSNEAFLDKYVGEGKKYKDVEELAKAYHHADAFIPTLKSDLDSMKEFMTAQFGELAAKNASPNPNPNPRPNDDGGEPNQQKVPASPPKAGEEEVNLDERIRRAMSELDEEKRAKENARITEDAMMAHYGNKDAAVEAVRQKAEELGVSPQWLADSAFSSPKAFFSVMGISDQKPTSKNTPGSTSDVNPQRFAALTPGVKPGTYAYYEQIRKTDPIRYRSVDTQSQLMADAQRLGADFFKR